MGYAVFRPERVDWAYRNRDTLAMVAEHNLNCHLARMHRGGGPPPYPTTEYIMNALDEGERMNWRDF